jgi:hypothetical protein
MELIMSVPGELTLALIRTGQELFRAGLEALALEAYERRVTGYQLSRPFVLPKKMLSSAGVADPPDCDCRRERALGNELLFVRQHGSGLGFALA